MGGELRRSQVDKPQIESTLYSLNYRLIRDLTRELEDAGSLSSLGAGGSVCCDRLRAAVITGQPWHVSTAWSTAKTASCVAADEVYRVLETRQPIAAGAVRCDLCGGGREVSEEGRGGENKRFDARKKTKQKRTASLYFWNDRLIRDLTRELENAGSLSGLGTQSSVGCDSRGAALVAGQPWHVSTALSTAKTASCVATDEVHRVLDTRKAVAAGVVNGDICGGGGGGGVQGVKGGDNKWGG